VSFVVINKDDRGVVDTLEALRATQADVVSTTETVVVDASEGRLDDVRERFPDAVWLPFTPQPAKPTIPEQRNVGVSATSGDVVVFIDASCVPDPGWLPRLIEPIVRDGERIVAGSHRSSGGSGLRDETARLLGDVRYVDEAPTINLAVRRDVVEAVGGFDETFHYGSDVDFTWRAVEHGHPIRYVPEACVAHDWGDRGAELRRSYLYGQARLRLYAKHPHRRRHLLGRDLPALAYPLFLLALPLALVRPRILGLLAIPLVRNARRQPVLTLIDHLVYGAGVLTALVQLRSEG
jgi:glycosyltransferase involved in cell wall biosynthesis